MVANKQGGGTCPYCGKEKKNLNSHIVQSAGNGHGPGREYPETWDSDARELIDEPDGSAVEGTGGGEPETGGEVFDLDRLDEEQSTSSGESGETDESDEPETEALELGFDDIEPREYECGNCQEPVPYLGGDDRSGGGKECPECHERLWWSEVEA